MRKTSLLSLVAGAALLAPAAAQAHVTLNPREAPAGAFTQLDVRVPNERDDAATVKVDLKLPDGFAFVSYEPKPGWTVKVYKSRLATPIKTGHGDEITEQVSRIVWTGSGTGDGKISPGQFMNFPLSVRVPDQAGQTLTFKALQTYSSGEVVRWIGEEDADAPAPTVKVTAAAADDHHAAAPATPAAGASDSADSGGSDGLAVAALIVGIAALLAAGAAAMTGRRRVRGAA
jgi:uncharacterized protein YcnI